MVILINVTQYGASFLLQCLKNHQTCSYPLLPALGGYQKQEKKLLQAVFGAILSIHNHSSQKNQSNKFWYVTTVLKRIGKKREKKTAFITTSSLMRIANSLRLFEITRTGSHSILKYLKTDPAVIKTIKYPPNTGLYFKTDKVATYIKRLWTSNFMNTYNNKLMINVSFGLWIYSFRKHLRGCSKDVSLK